MFDAQALLNAATEEVNSTRVLPAPVGDYIGQVTKVDVKSGIGKNSGEPWVRLELVLEAEDPKLESIGMTKKRFNGGFMLDITPSGSLDMSEGKNIQLGRAREACGLNREGQAFSLGMFQGQTFKFTVEHEPDSRDPTVIWERVKGLRSVTA